MKAARKVAEAHLDASIAAKTAMRQGLMDEIARVAALLQERVAAGGTIFFCGNGGSAADAQHWATELVVRYRKDRPAIAAVALTTDTSALTAAGNDLGFDRVFARQVEALVKPKDVVVCISTSGNSKNVLAAATTAKRIGAKAVGLTGEEGGALAGVVDLCLRAPSGETAIIQECHEAIGHVLCAYLEQVAGS
ncbi:MAG: SIS domain-containing protein [Candidatus Brocadiae bacterium]|nr:SIS domain-containing protein [Candidatus Brocadiia bacterium]